MPIPMNKKIEFLFATIGSLTQQAIEYHSARPKDKPSCPFGCHGVVHWHGWYLRYLYCFTPGHGYPKIKVYRIICMVCGRTTVCLHPFILKHAQTPLPMLVMFFVLMDTVKLSLRSAVKKVWHTTNRSIGQYWRDQRGRLLAIGNYLFGLNMQDSRNKFLRLFNLMKKESNGKSHSSLAIMQESLTG